MNANALYVVCPHCDAVNRVPQARLAEQPRCGSCHRALFDGHPVALNERRFQIHATRSELPLVVDFWAPWCAPCRAMAPAYEQAARVIEPRARLAKVDTEANPGLGRQFNIRSIPTLAVFRGGHEIARQSGAMPGPMLNEWILRSLR